MTDFNTQSYALHQKHYQKLDDRKRMESWARKDTVDYWRHERMYRCLEPLLEGYPGSDWLTVGDGRYGTDANYIQEKGGQALASDISDHYLALAKANGFIQNYQIENAEKLSFAEDCFDFVLCKEAYHHFPRPMVALYEMLRVARQGVILIEPNDANVVIVQRVAFRSAIQLAWRSIKANIKRYLGKPSYYPFGNYELVGNYVYSISIREIEKVALGLNYPAIAIKGLNDYYEEGIEFEQTTQKSPLFQKVQKMIRVADEKMNKNLQPPSLLATIIFKQIPSDQTIKLLKSQSFEFYLLPRNPYV